MKAAFVLLLAMVTACSSARAQDAVPLSPPPHAAASASSAPRLAPIDGRAYWARFDAEQASRQARLDSVDLRAPKILTLSLLVPAATLLLTAALNSLIEWSPVSPFEALPSHSGNRHPDREPGRVNPRNYWVAGAGGVLALGTIGAGIWWRQRALARKQLELEQSASAPDTSLRRPVLAVRVEARGVGLVIGGRL